MKRAVVVEILLAGSLILMGCASGRYATGTRGEFNSTDSLSHMTLHDVITMSRAGISDSVIITMMDASGSRFSLRTPEVVALADSGVSDNVIHAMISSDRPREEVDRRVYPDEYWYGGYYAFWDPWFYGYYPFVGRHRMYVYRGPGFGRFHR